MHESQTEPGIRSRTKTFHEPWHDAECSDHADQRKGNEKRRPGRTRSGEFGHADDDQSVDQHQQQHDASHSAPKNSPSDSERFPICRSHLKSFGLRPCHGCESHGYDELGFGTGGWGGGIGPVGLGVGSVGPGLGSVGGGLASYGRMVVAVAVGAITKQLRIKRLIATTLRIRSPMEALALQLSVPIKPWVPRSRPFHDRDPRIDGIPPRMDRTRGVVAHDVRMSRRIDRRFPRKAGRGTRTIESCG